MDRSDFRDDNNKLKLCDYLTFRLNHKIIVNQNDDLQEYDNLLCVLLR